jgi:outer membrane lipoprotein-sorting protein
VRTIGLLATEVKSDGELTLVAPDRLRWELFPPDAISYWVTPEGFAFATPDGGGSVGKAAAGRFATVLSDLLVLVGGDLASLRARYDFTVTKAGDTTTLVATPRDPEVRRQVARLQMAMGPELWTVQRIVIEEAGGDRSEITFRDVRRDVPVEPAKMRPPKP